MPRAPARPPTTHLHRGGYPGSHAHPTTRAPGCHHWSSRLLGGHLGVSHMTVACIWRDYGLQPWRQETFKFSTDLELVAKVQDIVGLYLEPPPESAVVLCVDEKSQIQALDRTTPMLPIRPGLPERRTHDYKRNGTTTLFAALEVATARVTDACYSRHRHEHHEQFLRFLEQVAGTYPGRDLRVVLDNYCAHKHADVKNWLGKNPRVKLHFTPTSDSRMNRGEVFFGIITRQAIRRGTSPSVADLIAAIRRFIDARNDRCEPFTWTKDTDVVLSKAKRQDASVTRHYIPNQERDSDRLNDRFVELDVQSNSKPRMSICSTSRYAASQRSSCRRRLTLCAAWSMRNAARTGWTAETDIAIATSTRQPTSPS